MTLNLPSKSIADRIGIFLALGSSDKNPSGLSNVSSNGDLGSLIRPGGILRGLDERGWINGQTLVCFHRPFGEANGGKGPMQFESLLKHAPEVRTNLASTVGSIDQWLHQRNCTAIYYLGALSEGLSRDDFWATLAPLRYLHGHIAIDASNNTELFSPNGLLLAELIIEMRKQGREVIIENAHHKNYPWLWNQWAFTSEQIRWTHMNFAQQNLPLIRMLMPGETRTHSDEQYRTPGPEAVSDARSKGEIVLLRESTSMTFSEFMSLVPDVVPPAYWRRHPMNQPSDKPPSGGSGG